MRYDTLLLQKISLSTSEVRGALAGAQLLDRPVRVLRHDAGELASHGEALRRGTCVPVGSVEFVRAALSAAGVTEPTWNCYPPELQRWLGRSVLRATAGVISGRWFVKPAAQIKLFDGFVLDTQLRTADWSLRSTSERETVTTSQSSEARRRISAPPTMPRCPATQTRLPARE